MTYAMPLRAEATVTTAELAAPAPALAEAAENENMGHLLAVATAPREGSPITLGPEESLRQKVALLREALDAIQAA